MTIRHDDVRATISVAVNGEPVTIDASASVESLLVDRGLAGKRLAVERNGVIVPRSLHGATRMHEGDRIEIVVAVGGG